MAKELQKPGSVRRIVITGPESTGKTELAGQLAGHYGCSLVPEYARTYVEKLRRPYNYLDVLHIARVQQKEQDISKLQQHQFIFFDTDLIITKVWFDLVYGTCPDWVIEAIQNSRISLYLLCDIDIPWIRDNVRENGGEARLRLFDIYRQEISHFGYECRIVSGTGKFRLNNAVQIINKLFPVIDS